LRSTKKLVMKDEIPEEKRARFSRLVPPLRAADEVYEALILGLRDQHKNGFKKVVVGLSEGSTQRSWRCLRLMPGQRECCLRLHAVSLFLRGFTH
jgi:hypothetical protein